MAGSTVDPFGTGSYIPDPLAQFLSRVVPWSTAQPPEGYVNIHAFGGAIPMPFKGGGRAYGSLNEYGQLQSYVSYINRIGAEGFYCLSQQSRPGEPNKQGQLKALRKRENARLLRSFVLDLDVKPTGYPSQRAALEAALPFLDGLGIKAGFIVSTGRGLHVLIVLPEPVPLHVWQPLADQLIAAAQQAKLKFDVGVSRNPATLLRLPTTSNRKDPNNPLVCSVLGTGPDTPLAGLEAALTPWRGLTSGVAAPSRSVAAPRLDPAIFPPRPPITYGPEIARVSADRENIREVTSVDLLRAACPVVADSEARGGDGDREPLWFELAKLCHYIQNGRDYFHDLSSDDPRYDEQATDQKFDLATGQGWPQCATIAAASAEAAAICKTCAFNGKGQSPINYATRGLLGTTGAAMPMQATAAPTSTPVNGHVNGFLTSFVPLSNPIFVQDLHAIGYTLDHEGFIVTSDNKRVFKTKVKDIECRWETTKTGAEVLRLNVMVPKGTQLNEDKVVTFLAGEVASPSGAVAVRNQGLTFDPRNHSMVVTIVDDWTTLIRQRRDAHADVRLGWVKVDGIIEGFAYGGYIFTPNGKQVTSIPRRDHPLTPRGNLSDWRKAANTYVGKGCIEMEVMMATAFAAPLVGLTGAEGLIVCARGDTGLGKSASLTCSASVWGSRSQIPTSATMNYIDTEIATKNNLPVYFDEIAPSAKGNNSAEKFGAMVLRISSGLERGRNDRASNQNAVRMSQTMLVAASNHSLTEIASGRDTSAQAARVFEIEMSAAIRRVGIPESQVGEVKKMLEANYGQAGLVYAEYIGRNQVQVEAEVKKAIVFFERKLNLGQVERYWVIAAATLLIGAMISKQLQLIDFDTVSMKKFLLEHLQRQRDIVKDMSMDANDPEVQLARVRSFMNSSQNWVITDTLAKQGGVPGACKLRPSDPTHFTRMRDFILRWAYDDKKVLISEDKLKAWCVKETISYRDLHKTLEKHHYCTRPRKPRSLTAGTVLNSATEIVLVFDLTLPCNATLVVEDDHGV